MIITRMQNKLKRGNKEALKDFLNDYYVIGAIIDAKNGIADEESPYIAGAIITYQKIKAYYRI